MKPLLLLLTGFLCFTMIACQKEKMTAEELHDVSTVSGPSTGNANTDVVLTVTYPYRNGCDYIEKFTETKAENIITIKAIAKPMDKNVACTQDAGSRTIEYKFRSATAGNFELRFLKPDNSTINHTIVIQ